MVAQKEDPFLHLGSAHSWIAYTKDQNFNWP